jgi:hypothetical protein
VTCRRKVDDGKAAMAEANACLLVDEDALVVGTAMRNGIGHAADQGRVDPPIAQ